MKLGMRPRSKINAITWTLLLPVSFLFGDRVISRGMTRMVEGSEATMARLYTGRAAADIVVFGNSRAAKSFDGLEIESATGVRVENFGVNGVRPELVHAMMRDYASLNGYPSSLVLEVSYLKNRWDDRLAAEFLLWSQFGHATDSVLRERLARQSRGASLFHLRRFGSQQFFRVMVDHSGSRGQAGSRKRISSAALERVLSSPNIEFMFNRARVEELRSILHRWEEEGVDVNLVLVPYLAEYRDKVANLDSWLSEIESLLGRSITDDSNQVQAITKFADHVHLNLDGRREYSSYVSTSLIRLGKQQHRN